MSDEVVPDTKDWTWVLRERCPECGLDAGAVTLARAAAGLRHAAGAWSEVLSRPDVARRPAAGVWSPLEYGAHVRDALGVFHERLTLLLAGGADDVVFPDWDQDAAALAEDYAAQSPAEVAETLGLGAVALADEIDALPANGLRSGEASRGTRSDGAQFTVTTLLQYLWHDVVHHLHDVGYDAGTRPE